jgi:hypothetical protein
MDLEGMLCNMNSNIYFSVITDMNLPMAIAMKVNSGMAYSLAKVNSQLPMETAMRESSKRIFIMDMAYLWMQKMETSMKDILKWGKERY